MIKSFFKFITGCLFVLGVFFILGAICGFLYEIFMMGFRLS